MYHPYFRGKQYELITIREKATLLATSGFRPIIEPVRKDGLGGLQKALDAVVQAGGRAILVVNPHYGELSGETAALTGLLREKFLNRPGISAGILLEPGMTLGAALECYQAHSRHAPAFIHAGFTEARALAESLGTQTTERPHIFLDRACGKLYQKHFKGGCRVLLRDGFKKKERNADYDAVEPFSDLHATYKEEGMEGFGDFLTVGDDYNEGGGPAYAVAIHLTFIDHEQDDAMRIYHFVSRRQDTPKDPAGKFAEALAKLIEKLDMPGSKLFETDAVTEFRALHNRKHFPGLGYVKKLSMNHHIETLAKYIQTAA